MQINRMQPGARMSGAVSYNGFVFLSGQVADDTGADVAGQTQQILSKIDKLLEEAGSNKSKILSANIWLAEATSFSEMNSVWDAWVPAGNTPARACVESKLAFPQYTVEIGVIAAT